VLHFALSKSLTVAAVGSALIIFHPEAWTECKISLGAAAGMTLAMAV
jgi:hypothetical protein